MLVLYRFWPGAHGAVVGALAAAPVRSTIGAGLHLSRVVLLRGPYALAIELDGDPPADAAAGLALDLVEAIADGRAGRRPSEHGWTVGVAPREPNLGQPASKPASRPQLVFRTRGGWNVVDAPADRGAWRTLSMTFLNRDLYERVDASAAWMEPEVLEVAALVLGTHRAEDVEGTCGIYGIPGGQVTRWRDDQRVGSPGIAELVQCAAVLRGVALDDIERTSQGRVATR